MADAYSGVRSTPTIPPPGWPRARDAISHATASGPSLPEVQTSLDYFKFWLDWDWVAAEQPSASPSRSIRVIPWHTVPG